VDHSTVADAWRDYGVKPCKAETFKFSTDPELVAKVTDVVERQAIRRGTFTSVRDLMIKIREFVNGWNPRALSPSLPPGWMSKRSSDRVCQFRVAAGDRRAQVLAPKIMALTEPTPGNLCRVELQRETRQLAAMTGDAQGSQGAQALLAAAAVVTEIVSRVADA
jgi:hypothetical protein